MAELTDISSIISNSLYLKLLDNTTLNQRIQQVQEKSKTLQTLLGEDFAEKLNDEFGISLKDYTNLNTYGTVMNMLYGNNSANRFQNLMQFYVGDNENKLASAKSFVNKMKENGMSTNRAVKTYTALQKYSLMSSIGNFNYVNAKI